MVGSGADEVRCKYEADLGKQHVSWSPTLLSAGGCKGWFFSCPLSLSAERGMGTPHPQREARGALPRRAVVGWRPPPWAGPEGHRERAT